MKRALYYSIVIFILFSCRSATTIYTNEPGANVYIGNKLKGTTPYVHIDMLPSFCSRKVRIEKEGFLPVETKIKKNSFNQRALFGIFMQVYPVAL